MPSSPTPTAIVARNSIYQLAFKILTVALSMVTFSLVARFLSVEQYGEYTLISTIFALLIGFSDLRVEQVVVRDASTDESALPRLAFNASFAKLIFSVLIALLSLLFIWLSSYSEIVKIGVTLASVGVLLNAMQVGFHSSIQYSLRAYLLTLAEVVAKLIVAGAVALVFWLGLQGVLGKTEALYSFIIALLVISPLIVLLCYAYWSTKTLDYKLSWTVDTALIKSLLKQSWPLWVMGLLALIHYRADVLILSAMKTEYDVGIYGLAYRLLDVTVTLPPLFIASIYPILSRLASNDVERSNAVLKKSFNAMLLFVLLLAAGTFYAAPQIIGLFGGGGYDHSVLVLRILSIAMVGSYLSSIFVPYLVAHRAQKWAVWSLGISVLVNLILNVVLIPMYSYYGAAWTTAVSEILGFIIIALIVGWKFSVWMDGKIITKALLATSAMLAVLWLTGLHANVSSSVFGQLVQLVIIGITGLAVFLINVWILKAIDKDVLEQSLSLLPTARFTRRRNNE